MTAAVHTELHTEAPVHVVPLGDVACSGSAEDRISTAWLLLIGAFVGAQGTQWTRLLVPASFTSLNPQVSMPSRSGGTD
jgi:hypothetical protein